MSKTSYTDTANYILTFVAVVVVIGSFATQLITGTTPLLAMDSLAGSLLLGIIFISYLIWLIFDTASWQNLTVKESAIQTMKSNPTSYCIYAFWLVFIIIPILFR